MSIDPARIERIADLAVAREVRVVTAESLTCGNVATTLGTGPDASRWFGGAIVAYQEQIKFEVLGVPEGPVVTRECAEQMARGARELLMADVAVSCTGVGGPDPSEGKPAGTVMIAVATAQGVDVHELSLEGGPDEVLEQTTSECLGLLEQVLGAD